MWPLNQGPVNDDNFYDLVMKPTLLITGLIAICGGTLMIIMGDSHHRGTGVGVVAGGLLALSYMLVKHMLDRQTN